MSTLYLYNALTAPKTGLGTEQIHDAYTSIVHVYMYSVMNNV